MQMCKQSLCRAFILKPEYCSCLVLLSNLLSLIHSLGCLLLSRAATVLTIVFILSLSLLFPYLERTNRSTRKAPNPYVAHQLHTFNSTRNYYRCPASIPKGRPKRGCFRYHLRRCLDGLQLCPWLYPRSLPGLEGCPGGRSHAGTRLFFVGFYVPWLWELQM